MPGPLPLAARPTAGLVLVLCCACVAGGVEVVPGPEVPDRSGEALVLGDSIVVGARDIGELPAALEAEGWVAEVVAEEGRTVGWAIEQVEPRATVPADVVVGMGSNPGPEVGAFPEEVRTLLDALVARGAQRVYWVPPVHADPRRYDERVQALVDASGGPLIVVDWPVQMAVHPERFGGDGLHLTADGYAALAAFIVAALEGRADQIAAAMSAA